MTSQKKYVCEYMSRSCATCMSRELQRKYCADPKERERLRENDRRRDAKPGRQERKNKAAREWRARNREQDLVNKAVGKALSDGVLVKGPCEIGVGCRGRIEAHHPDYNKPLEVRWLCNEHHWELHRLAKTNPFLAPIRIKK